jgi:flagellar FliJ protein
VSEPQFTFRLQKLLSLRESEEKLAKEQLAESLSHVVAGESRLRAAEALVQEARAEQRESLAGGPTTGAGLAAVQAYLERAERAEQAMAEELRDRERELEARRLLLAAVARKREAVERVKARRRREHMQVVERVRGAVLDELGVAAFRRSAA